MSSLFSEEKMEVQNPQPRQIIEIHGDLPVEAQSLGGNRVCRGATCGFSDSETSSKDAEERRASMKKLVMAVVLCVIFMSVEVVGGIRANSLAILTDAAHLLSDVAAFAISLFSLWASGWEANPRQSYGFFRIEILGALISIQLIWLLTGILVYEAVVRIIYETGEVQGSLMFGVAAFGLLVNIIMALLLGHDHGHGHHGHGHSHGDHTHNHAHDEEHGHAHANAHPHHHHRISISTNHHLHKDEQSQVKVHFNGNEDHSPLLPHSEETGAAKDGSSNKRIIEQQQQQQRRQSHNVNVEGAYIHVLGDCIQSVGVMVGGAVIWCKPEWKIIDLACTLLFSVIVLYTTIKMLRNVIEILMESTPREIDATRLEKGLCLLDEVVAVHELHIWAITMGKVLLACHVTITPEAEADVVLDKVVDYIRREYNISHVTVQIERQ